MDSLGHSGRFAVHQLPVGEGVGEGRPGAAEVAEAVIKRVRHNVYKTTLDLRSRMIRCSVSIGVVNYPKDARDMRELLSMADRKMYRDKELRRAPGHEANG